MNDTNTVTQTTTNKAIYFSKTGSVASTANLDEIEKHLVGEAAHGYGTAIILTAVSQALGIPVIRTSDWGESYFYYSPDIFCGGSKFTWTDCRYTPEYRITHDGDKEMIFVRQKVELQNHLREKYTSWSYTIQGSDHLGMDAALVEGFLPSADSGNDEAFCHMRIDGAMEMARRLDYKPMITWEWTEKADYRKYDRQNK